MTNTNIQGPFVTVCHDKQPTDKHLNKNIRLLYEELNVRLRYPNACHRIVHQIPGFERRNTARAMAQKPGVNR